MIVLLYLVFMRNKLGNDAFYFYCDHKLETGDDGLILTRNYQSGYIFENEKRCAMKKQSFNYVNRCVILHDIETTLKCRYFGQRNSFVFISNKTRILVNAHKSSC